MIRAFLKPPSPHTWLLDLHCAEFDTIRLFSQYLTYTSQVWKCETHSTHTGPVNEVKLNLLSSLTFETKQKHIHRFEAFERRVLNFFVEKRR